MGRGWTRRAAELEGAGDRVQDGQSTKQQLGLRDQEEQHRQQIASLRGDGLLMTKVMDCSCGRSRSVLISLQVQLMTAGNIQWRKAEPPLALWKKAAAGSGEEGWRGGGWRG